MTLHRHWTSLPDDIPGTAPAAFKKPAEAPVFDIRQAFEELRSEIQAEQAMRAKLQETVNAQDAHICRLMREVAQLQVIKSSQGVQVSPSVFGQITPNLWPRSDYDKQLDLIRAKQTRDYLFANKPIATGKTIGVTADLQAPHLQQSVIDHQWAVAQMGSRLANKAVGAVGNDVKAATATDEATIHFHGNELRYGRQSECEQCKPK